MSTTRVSTAVATVEVHVLAVGRASRDDAEALRQPSVRHRNAGGGRSRDGRRHAGDDLVRDAGHRAGDRLLAPATEHERIASFRRTTTDRRTRAPPTARRSRAEAWPSDRAPCPRRYARRLGRQVEEGRRGEAIEHDDVRVAEHVRASEREEPRITRARAHEVDGAASCAACGPARAETIPHHATPSSISRRRRRAAARPPDPGRQAPAPHRDPAPPASGRSARRDRAASGGCPREPPGGSRSLPPTPGRTGRSASPAVAWPPRGIGRPSRSRSRGPSAHDGRRGEVAVRHVVHHVHEDAAVARGMGDLVALAGIRR